MKSKVVDMAEWKKQKEAEELAREMEVYADAMAEPISLTDYTPSHEVYDGEGYE